MPTHSRVIDLVDIQSSQESHDHGHPTPPPQRHNKKRKSARYANNNAVQRRSISNEDEEDDSDNDMDFNDEVDNEYNAL